MQLTKLELKGFKSFADKVIINFDKGITGIVGPNGCGKSNIIDAIRWVLGEQKSRVLRSDKMESVIFNGTKTRKATQFAEVSMTFNNTKNLIPTEYDQVTITRRYYRSGESEYLLNGIICRLKDIINLFLDTGIASNSYAIIELKMIEDLLNDKENSRRTLFEEAAGISKFKIRKKETLKKLSDTDSDLERIDDLLFEIEKNLKSLERQANQTKKYYELKEEYKHLSITLAKKRLDYQKEHFHTIEKQIQEGNDKRRALNIILTEKEAKIEQEKTSLINKEKQLSSKQKTLNEHISTIRQYESDKKIKNERQKFLQDKILSFEEQINDDKERSNRSSISLKGLRNEAHEVQNSVIQIQNDVNQLKIELEAQKKLTNDAQKNLNSIIHNHVQKKNQHFQLKKEIEIKDIQLKSMFSELNKTSEDSNEKNIDIKNFKEKLEQIISKKSKKEEIYKQLTATEKNTQFQLSTIESQLFKKGEELNLINRSLDAKVNEFNLTKSLVDNLEGFPEAIKFLKKTPQWEDAPILSDIISCPEEYRIAIENFLAPYMNYYIVESRLSALKAVNLLTASSKGKAHFFILENLSSYEIGSVKAPSNSKLVIDLINFDERYSNLIKYLLWNVYIANSPIYDGEDNLVLLDEEGKVAQSKFTVFGGSIGLFEGKRIGRAKHLESLEKEIQELKIIQITETKVIKQLQQTYEKLKESSKKNALDDLKEELSKIKEVEVSIKMKQEQFLELLSYSKNRKEDISKQIDELKQTLSIIKPQIGETQKEVGLMEKDIEVKKNKVINLQETLDLKSSIYNEKNIEFHQKQNKYNSILQEISFKEEAHENSTERIKKNQEELKLVSTNLDTLIKKTNSNDDELVNMYAEKETIEQNVNEAEKTYYSNRELIDNEEKGLKKIHREREEIDIVLVAYHNKENDTKINLNSIKDRLSVEFNIDLEKVSDEEVEKYKEYNEENLKDKVHKYRSKLDNMGSINSMALEAFEEMSKRYNFIRSQKEDLIKSKDLLLVTISEIDEVAKSTFMAAFHQIKDNFIKVFRTLFTDEDDCDLILTDSINPLDSPIDIIAKPKGKRPLTINQLSGGEKTLTAISLLFSIYLLKPAPFCIFDEVDAPLDDENIDKFNQIIRKFSNESQFIIVTHNKRTMVSTDVIYGVTMQEQGVSKVLPIDLRDFP